MALLRALVGGVTQTAATVKLGVATTDTNVELLVSTDSGLASPTVLGPSNPDAEGYITFAVSGLTAGTRYYFGARINGGATEAMTGSFNTVPAAAADFTFLASACHRTASNHQVFARMQARAASSLFFMHMGDWGYGDINTADESLFIDEMEATLAGANPNAFFRNTALVWMWDDHDYGGPSPEDPTPGNGDNRNPAKTAARAWVSRCVPTHPMVEVDGALYHAFTVGRVRFVMTDLRWHRDPNLDATGANYDSATKTMLGATQKQWFKGQMTAARDDPSVDAIIWGCTSLWIWGDDHPMRQVGTWCASEDSWSQFATERAELSQFMVDEGISGHIVNLTSDGHCAAMDDGRNADPANVGLLMPVLAAGPLDQGSQRTAGGHFHHGGPYWRGWWDSPNTDASSLLGQYAAVRVEQVAGDTRFTCSIYRAHGGGSTEEKIAEWTFTLPAFGTSTSRQAINPPSSESVDVYL